jgi:FtsP/CotA-like multicopper oxidase with cupredoxin domain
MASFGIRMGFDLTYYYNLVDPGTYLYHCHVEATEHMEMGMLGNLYIKPRQDLYARKTLTTVNGFSQFAYNDCDNLPAYNAGKSDFETTLLTLSGPLCGSTGYDVEKAIQFSDFDSNFHEKSLAADVLPFADMESSYFMLNGRGYPDTVNPSVLNNAGEVDEPDYFSQPIDSKVNATVGQKVLLRLSNLSIQNFATLEFNGPAFKVVGKCAKLLRGPDGKDLSYSANSVLIGPGETFDLILDTTGWTAGTYYFFSRNLNQLNNNQMERGGAMTEIIVN